MRHVVFVAPFPMPATMRFAQALSRLEGVRLTGVFQKAPSTDTGFAEVEIVADALAPDQVSGAVTRLAARYGRPARLIGILENIQDCLATVREELSIPGVDRETSRRFRDKATMKEHLRAAKLPCARHRSLTTAADAWSFVDEVGYPIVLKPPAGAGCVATLRADHPQGLAAALEQLRPEPSRPVLAEEFLSGAEFSFETLTVDGEVRFHSIGRYHPAPLEVMTTPWIQWVVHLPRDISGPEFDAVRDAGQKTITALGLETGVTHMEWFRRPDGSVAIGEIAARPPGAQIVNLMSWAHDCDMHAIWADLMVNNSVPDNLERRYSVAVAFLRGSGSGRIVSIDGLDEAHRKMGHLVVDRKLPVVGQPKAQGYEGEGWVIVRHEDDEVVKRAVFDLITTVKIRYA